ncbi:MAG: hypothetical protein IIV16_02180 [Alistipes sp.]|nr:hypothetical protein [Alistipes sp.]
MKMKQMPYRVEEGAIERAKYRAKMAVREAAHPAEQRPHKIQLRWATVVTVVAVIAVGVIGFMTYQEHVTKPLSPMEELIAQMKSTPDEILNDLAVDTFYYGEDPNAL